MNEKEEIAYIKELEEQIRVAERAVLPGYEDYASINKPPVTTAKMAKAINSVMDWSRFFRLVVALGTDCNDRQERFDKGTILEHSMEIYSDGNIQYIGATGRLGDLQMAVDGKLIRVEQKFNHKSIFTPKGLPSKGIKRQSIVNWQRSKQKTEGLVIPENFPDFLLLASGTGAALISKYDFVQRGLINQHDALFAQYEFSDLTILHGPVVDVELLHIKTSYKELKRKLHEDYIRGVL